MTTYGDNAFAPGAVSDTYVPDQLIAGNLKLVTDTVTIGSGQVLKRGSVLGRAAFGSLSASAGTANASGTILVAAAPAAGDTLTVQGLPSPLWRRTLSAIRSPSAPAGPR
jgi:hypothetical protein